MALKTTQLDHVAIHVEDVDRSVAFYRDMLDLKPIPRPAFSFPGAWFRLGTHQELHIIGERRSPTLDAGHRANHFALLIESMDDAEADLKAKGVAYRPRQTRPDGATQIFLLDPDGHCIELCQPV